MTTELAVPQENDLAIEPTFHAVAVNATEMKAANDGIKMWLRSKVANIESDLTELEAQLESARKHKWKTSTFQGMIQRMKQKHLYYGKILAASEAGFTIVPDMPVDVFAIRVKRDAPAAKSVRDSAQGYKPNPNVADEEEQRLSVGEGRYESPVQMQTIERSEEKDATGKVVKYIAIAAATDWGEIDFPLAVAHSVVMDATARALAMKIFDRVGVVRNGSGDPIVLGQITRKQGWSTKTASFLIAWYLDPRTL